MNQIKKYSLYAIALPLLLVGCQQQSVEWISTVENSMWTSVPDLKVEKFAGEADFVEVLLDKPQQKILGFGACFNELGWTSLNALSETDKNSVFEELFAPGKGASFNICRMPVAANDFALKWYSYNETPDDLEMKNFSIANDEKTLIPFIKEAKKFMPSLQLWASPWCPPTWMKYNKNCVCRPDPAVNDLQGDPNLNLEGTDMFIVKDEYLKAYALYFGKFIDAYREKGIDISMVAPQNEFNSCQNFPSCTWTATSLGRFVGQYLGPEMQKRKVSIMCGTVERASMAMVDTILTLGKPYIDCAGFQWAGSGVIADVHKKYPELLLYQTEQECGNGKNSWKGAVYSWKLTEHYLSSGASIYDYWNISLSKGGISHWGWAQNSLVVVDTVAKTFVYTPEYYVLKHFSHYIQPQATRLATSDYENLLAFRNPDNSIVVTLANLGETDKTVRVKIGEKMINPTLKAGSLNTFVVKE